jgi:hypothetical protein
VDPDQPVGVPKPEEVGHGGPDVHPLGCEAGVAKLLHQPDPEPRDAPREVSLHGAVGESVAGQGWDDHVEGVVRISPVASRVAQQRDDLRELKECARPAVGEDQRQGVGPFAPLVDEVEAEAVDLGAEVGEAVDALLLLSPVETALPVLDQLPHVGEVRPVVPVSAGDLVRSSRAGEAFPQVIENLLGNSHLKRLDVHVGAIMPSPTQ